MNLGMTTKRKRFGALVGLALVSGAALVGVAGAQGSAPETPWFAMTKPVASSVQEDQANAFAVFGRARTARDEMPRQAKEQVGNSTRSGRNLDLSRAVSTPTGTGWAVPGNRAVCLVVPDPVDGYGITCTDTDHALTHGLVAILISPDKPTAAEFTMLSPRQSRITATMTDGRIRTLKADDDGVVSATLVGAQEIAVETSRGTQRLAMPIAPPAQPTGKDCGDGRIIDAAAICRNG